LVDYNTLQIYIFTAIRKEKYLTFPFFYILPTYIMNLGSFHFQFGLKNVVGDNCCTKQVKFICHRWMRKYMKNLCVPIKQKLQLNLGCHDRDAYRKGTILIPWFSQLVLYFSFCCCDKSVVLSNLDNISIT